MAHPVTGPVWVMVLALTAGWLGGPASAPAGDAPAADAERAEDGRDAPGSAPAVTRHQVTLTDGRTLGYRATAGFVPITDDVGKTTGRVFTVAYEVGQEDGTAPPRPLTFVFNGGPGAASAFLHFGGLGPRRVVFGPDGAVPPPPVRLAANPETWLAFTDLVFVDPIGTGYSRPVAPSADGKDPANGGKRFWGIRQDLDALDDVIRRVLSRTGRWDAPLYLAGESYGGFRAAALALHLARRAVAVNGVVLISPALEFLPLRGGPIALVPWVTVVPSLAATAIAHGKAGGGGDALTDTLAEVERFAMTDLLTGLAAGDTLPTAERDALYRRLAAMIGLPVRVVAQSRGKVSKYRFAKELLRDQERLVSLYDGTLALTDPAPNRPGLGFDELSLHRLTAPFLAAAADHLRDALGVTVDQPYEILSERVFEAWDWHSRHDGAERGLPGAAAALETAMAITPGMRAMVVHGVHDLATPYFATVYALRQLHVAPDAKARLTVRVYPGGHMFYMRDAQLVAFTRDAAAMYRADGG